MRKPRFYSLSIPAGALLLAACHSSTPSAPQARPATVNILQAAFEAVPEVVETPGSVQPRQRVQLSAQIPGSVREVRVKAGDRVSASQLLASLDTRDADGQKAAAVAAVDETAAAVLEARKGADMALSARDAAKAAADLASSTWARYEKLFATRSASPQEVDEVKARRDAAAAELAVRGTLVASAQDRLHQATARMEQAKAQAARSDVVLGWTTVKAPFAGRVAERQVDPGAVIFPGSPLLVIETSENPQVLAEIPGIQSQLLKLGLEVLIHDRDTAASSMIGRISEIIPRSDPGSHSCQFKVDLPAGIALASGRFVIVSVPSGNRQAMLVPRQAVRETGQLTGVFLVDSASIARFRLVKAVPYGADQMEILSGIEAGDRILARPGNEIVDGSPLEVLR